MNLTYNEITFPDGCRVTCVDSIKNGTLTERIDDYMATVQFDGEQETTCCLIDRLVPA